MTTTKLFAAPRSRFNWVGWTLLVSLFFGGGFMVGWTAALLNCTK